MVSNKFYLLLDLNQWLLPYESNTLTAELSRSFIIPKRTKWYSPYGWIRNIILLDYKYLITYKQYEFKQYHSNRSNIYDVDSSWQEIIYRIKYVSQAIRAIAQLVEHLVYTRANVFQGNPSYNPITKMVILIDVLPHWGNNSLTEDSVQLRCLFRCPIDLIMELRYW